MQGLMRNYKEKYARFTTELQGKVCEVYYGTTRKSMQGLLRNYKEKYARFNTELQGKVCKV